MTVTPLRRMTPVAGPYLWWPPHGCDRLLVFGARPLGLTWPPPRGPPSTLPTPTPTPRAEIRPVQLFDEEIRRLCTSRQDVFLSQPNLLELEAPIKVCVLQLGSEKDLPSLYLVAEALISPCIG
ncbi:hypothetical protein ZWY2020_020777 [Hordeum vulgare]|nr:hypothetical protein ZWY2020_020777 [Hordeum vulgare]